MAPRVDCSALGEGKELWLLQLPMEVGLAGAGGGEPCLPRLEHAAAARSHTSTG